MLIIFKPQRYNYPLIIAHFVHALLSALMQFVTFRPAFIRNDFGSGGTFVRCFTGE